MTLPLVSDGMGYDRALAAMFCRAKRGETVSLMAAQDQRDGGRWGCRMCWLLNLVVERNHCAITLRDEDRTVGISAWRAGLALLFGVLLPTSWLCWAAWHFVFLIIEAV